MNALQCTRPENIVVQVIGWQAAFGQEPPFEALWKLSLERPM